jgi:hypothetical protein
MVSKYETKVHYLGLFFQKIAESARFRSLAVLEES